MQQAALKPFQAPWESKDFESEIKAKKNILHLTIGWYINIQSIQGLRYMVFDWMNSNFIWNNDKVMLVEKNPLLHELVVFCDIFKTSTMYLKRSLVGLEEHE